MSGSIRLPDHDHHEPMTTRGGQTVCVIGGETLIPKIAVSVEPIEPDPSPRPSYDPDEEEIVELPPLRSVPEPEEPVDPETIVRTTDPQTSRDAAYMNPGRRGTQRYAYAEAFLRAHPAALTAYLAAKYAELDEWNASKRIAELRQRGIIEVVGETRTERGAMAQTYTLTEEGLGNMRARARADE